MTPDLVIGLDSSTQSTKAIAWSAEGAAVAEGRAPLTLAMPQKGWAEQEVADWWQAACTALGQVAAAVDPARIAAIAISNQRETTAYLGADGAALRPATLWLDERGRSELPGLVAALGAERLHAITGKPVDITPALSRIAWVRRHQPQVWAGLDRVLDVHGYLTLRLTGRASASWTSADPSGLFDIGAKVWSEPILAALGLDPARLAPALPPGTPVGVLTGAAARATGLAPGTPVIAAGGDGQCAGLGANAAQPGTLYLNLGTAMITGAWSAEPRIGRDWRSLCSPTGTGYFLEGCQRAGAFLINWLIDTFCGGRADPGVFGRLEAEARAIPHGSDGVLVSPYLTGCMDPHWDPDARASLTGLAPSHTPAHLYRAALEALTCESARCVAAMRASGLAPARIVAVGGGASNTLWTQMFADATGLPVTLSHSAEASALGAGMSAAVGVGWFPGFDAAATAMARDGATIVPDPAAAPAWAALSFRQARVYRREG